MTRDEQLQEAQAARHRILTGKGVASVTRGGKRVEFTQATIPELNRYINSLGGSRQAIRIGL